MKTEGCLDPEEQIQRPPDDRNPERGGKRDGQYGCLSKHEISDATYYPVELEVRISDASSSAPTQESR